MSNLTPRGKAFLTWQNAEAKDKRLKLLQNLAIEAGLNTEFYMIPQAIIDEFDYKEYLITVQGLAKIRELRRIADK
jgi:hypothetical protein